VRVEAKSVVPDQRTERADNFRQFCRHTVDSVVHELEEHREISPHDLLAFEIGVGLGEGIERAPIRDRIEIRARNGELIADVPVSQVVVGDPE
jgi:hypothetical protein